MWKYIAVLIVALTSYAAADPFVYEFSGTWGFTNFFWWTGGADYTITVTADNGGTDPFNEMYRPSDIIGLSLVSGSVTHSTLPFTSIGFAGATLTTTASGELQTIAPGSFGHWVTNGGATPYLDLGDPNQG